MGLKLIVQTDGHCLYPKSELLAQTGHSSIPVPAHFQSPELSICSVMGRQVLPAGCRVEQGGRGGWL